jgi:DhnA family fructose-bisphosphate aldolase class Ia
VDARLAGHACRIAAAAGLDLIEVWFTGHERDSRFLNVNLMPDLSNGEVADAVLRHLRGGVPCS